MPYTVYLSSTLNDLKADRAKVKEVLGEDCVVRTSYRASEDELVTSCLDDVAHCDVYILIVGLRYGFVPKDAALNPDGLSITELESRRARDMPRLVFLKDAEQIPFGLTDAKSRENPPERIEAFRAFLNGPGQPRPAVFVTPEDLGVAVTKAFADFKERRAGASTAAGTTQASAWLAAQLDRVESLQAEHQRATALRAEAAGREPVLDLAVAPARDGSANADADAAQRVEPRPLDEVLAQAAGALLVVGEGGGGKTTSLWRAAAAAARRARTDPAAPVPVCVNLALPGGAGDLAALRERVADSVAGVRDWDAWVAMLAATGRRALYIFDAFNEMPERVQADAVVALQLFAAKLAEDTCIVASRRVPQLEALLRGTSRFAAWEILRLQPEQVQGFLAELGLDALFAQLPQELLSLAGNPFMLIAIARTLGGESGPALPRNRGRLYERFVRGWMDHESLKPSRGLRYSYERVKQPLLARLAVRMTALGQTSLAEGEALDALAAAELGRIEQRTQRLGGLPQDWTVDDCLAEVVGDGLLRRAGGSLRFMHQSLQEFYAGLYFRAADPEALVEFTPAWVDGVSSATALPAQRFVNALLMMAGLQDDATALLRALHRRHGLVAAAALGAASVVDGAVVAELEAAWLADLQSDDAERRKFASCCVVQSRRPLGTLLRRVVALGLDRDTDVSYPARRALGGYADAGALAAALLEELAGLDDEALDERGPEIGWLLPDLPQPGFARALVEAWRNAAPGTPLRARLERMLATVGTRHLDTVLAAGDPAADALRSAVAEAESFGINARVLRRVREQALRRYDHRSAEFRAALSGADVDTLAEALHSDDEARSEAAAACIASRGLHELADAVGGLLLTDYRGHHGDELLKSLRALEGDAATARRLAAAIARGLPLVGNLPAELGRGLAGGPAPPGLERALQGWGLRGAIDIEARPGEAQGTRWIARPGFWGAGGPPEYLLEAGPQGVQVYDAAAPLQLLGRIGEVPGSEAEAVLLHALDGPDCALAAAAAGALARRVWPGLVPTLQARLARPADSREVKGWLEALGQAPAVDAGWLVGELLAIDTGSDGVPTHPRWGASPDGAGWSEALHAALVAQGSDAAARTAVAAALAGDDAARRRAALSEYQRWLDLRDQARADPWRAPDMVSLVYRLALDGADPDAAGVAAAIARRHGGAAARAFFVEALEHPDPAVAVAAAQVVADIDDAALRSTVGERMAPLALDRTLDPALRRGAGAALERAREASRLYEPIAQRLEAHDDAAALGLAEHALEALPDDVNLHWWHGHALRGLGRFAEAADSFARSAELAHDAPVIPRTQAALYLGLGNTARAVAEARRGVAIDPADAESQAMLAWSLYCDGDDVACADVAAIALRLDPVQAEVQWIALLVALRGAKPAAAATALAHLRRLQQHLGRTFDADWQAKLEAALAPLAPADVALRALRDEALARARDAGPQGA